MTPEERKEAIARLLCEQDGCEPNDLWIPGEQLWRAYAKKAEAVILATLQSLLEPSSAVWAAWASNPPPFGEAMPTHIVETMIRAVIKEHWKLSGWRTKRLRDMKMADRPTLPDTEIEITAEMIRAGSNALSHSGLLDPNVADWVTRQLSFEVLKEALSCARPG